MKKKIQKAKERSEKKRNSTFCVRTKYDNIPIKIAFNDKEVRAIAQNGKYTNIGIAKRQENDARDDCFGFQLAKTRAIIGILKTVRSKGLKRLNNEIEFYQNREKDLINNKYPDKH